MHLNKKKGRKKKFFRCTNPRKKSNIENLDNICSPKVPKPMIMTSMRMTWKWNFQIKRLNATTSKQTKRRYEIQPKIKNKNKEMNDIWKSI